jgi:hypothetical protein
MFEVPQYNHSSILLRVMSHHRDFIPFSRRAPSRVGYFFFAGIRPSLIKNSDSPITQACLVFSPSATVAARGASE